MFAGRGVFAGLRSVCSVRWAWRATATDDGVAVASAGSYANHLHLAPHRTTPAPNHSIFTARRNARIASAVLATAIPSVCPSVRLSHAGIVSKRRHIARCSLYCQIERGSVTQLTDHLNSVDSTGSIRFTYEEEAQRQMPFLHTLLIRTEDGISKKWCIERKPIQTSI